MSRRGFLGSAAMLGSGAVLAQGPAGQATTGPAPRVWLDLDQKALDDAYDQSVWAPNQAIVQGRYATNSELARTRLGSPRRVAYGPTAIEALDLYPTSRTNAPIAVFIHGGAWQRGLSKNYAFLAEPFVGAGAHFIIPDFINVLESGGSLLPMVDQVRAALGWIYRNARTFGGDARRIFLCAQSSGAHLAGVAVTTDWPNTSGLPRDLITGAMLVSGIYDLKPVRLSARSSYVAFTDEIEQSLSPQRHLELLSCPLVLAFGSNESPEFQRQTRDFAAAVRAAGKPVELIVADGYNHFEIVETLASPYGILGHAALAQMKLSSRS